MTEETHGGGGVAGGGAEQDQVPGPRPAWRNPWVIAFVMGAVTLTLLRPCMRYIPEPPPVVASLPSFALVDGAGEAFTLERLRGETAVVALVCASCGASDARRLQQLLELEASFAGAGLPVRIWALGVDPARDTPELLSQLGERLGAGAGWWWTTGPEEEIAQLVRVFAEAELGPSPEAPMWRQAGHAAFGVVDRAGRLRGFFAVDGPHGVDEVRHRAAHVHREPDGWNP